LAKRRRGEQPLPFCRDTPARAFGALMRLLHVVPTYLPATRYGGPIFAVHGLCHALAVRGHTVEVFTTSIDGPGDSDVPHGVPVMLEGVIVRYFASNRMRRLAFAPSLARALQRAMPGADAVHLHSVFLWPTWAAARLARKSQAPHVISPRGMLVKELIASRHRAIKSAWISLIEKPNLECASAIHTTSTHEAAELAKFGWRLPRLAVIPNGVDDVDGAPAVKPSADVAALAGAEPLILFFGRIAEVKGLDRLLHGFARTSRGNLAIVGTDYEHMASRLARLAKELNIAERVRIVPRTVAGADKEFVFAAARAFVLPSYSESFGNSVLEAMLRGLPVIITPEVGAAEIVREAGGGIVVDGDAVPLGRAIDRLVDEAGLARTMGEAGRRHVRNHYGWPSVAARMEAFYETLKA
jgi:glycosyltransferase involved in cell wall biosynthesis